ncbi:MAG: hypothetical protein ACI9YH_005034, partial [Colwellia sp.]
VRSLGTTYYLQEYCKLACYQHMFITLLIMNVSIVLFDCSSVGKNSDSDSRGFKSL